MAPRKNFKRFSRQCLENVLILFIKTIENTNKDVNDEFIKTIHSLCDDLPDNKKEKMLNVIKASTELIK